jgi:hypothetical protein
MSDSMTGAGNRAIDPKDRLEYLSGTDLLGDLAIVRELRVIATERKMQADKLHAKLVESTGLLPQTLRGMLKKPVKRGDAVGIHPITEHYVDSYEALAEAAASETRANEAEAELAPKYRGRRFSAIRVNEDLEVRRKFEKQRDIFINIYQK